MATKIIQMGAAGQGNFNSDLPLHAGLVTTLGNNLDQMYTDACYDHIVSRLTEHTNDVPHYWYTTASTASTWYHFDISPVCVPVRAKQGGGWKDYMIQIVACGSVARTWAVRAYLLPTYEIPDGFSTDATVDPIPNVPYAAFQITTASFAAGSRQPADSNHTANLTGLTSVDVLTGDGTAPCQVPVAYLHIFFSALVLPSATSLYIESIRIQEIP